MLRTTLLPLALALTATANDVEYVYAGEWGRPTPEAGYFEEVRAVATGPGGNVYVLGAQIVQEQVQAFDRSGKFLRMWEVEFASSLAVAPTGRVYVGSWINNCIAVYSPEGELLGVRGSEGDGDGQFRRLGGIAVARDGTVYVADESKHCVQYFSADGRFLGKWGGRGSGDGEFDGIYAPSAMAVAPDGTVCILDFILQGPDVVPRVQRFTRDGRLRDKVLWGKDDLPGVPSHLAVAPDGTGYVADSDFGVVHVSGSGEALAGWRLGKTPPGDDSPGDSGGGLAVGDDGTVYVLNGSRKSVQRYTPDGKYLGEIGGPPPLGCFAEPQSIAVSADGVVYVTDEWNDRVQLFTAAGAPLAAWDMDVTGGDSHNVVGGVACGPAREVYVADSDAGEIKCFDADGRLAAAWEWEETDPRYSGYYAMFGGIAASPAGVIYATDVGNARVRAFSAAGRMTHAWGSKGTGPGEFKSPEGVAVAPDGVVYVADSMNRRIQYFTAEGEYLGAWGSQGTGDGEFDLPCGVAVGPDGYVYVADSVNNRVQYFTAEGRFVGKFGRAGTGPGEFDYPIGLAFGPDGTLYVTDYINDRIQYFHRGYGEE